VRSATNPPPPPPPPPPPAPPRSPSPHLAASPAAGDSVSYWPQHDPHQPDPT
ncbi:hypothetical protein ACFDR9_004646, partial [Janthinobacterium sp. CG_23.3]